MIKDVFVVTFSIFIGTVTCVPFIVQTLSSDYALILGGYGQGYAEVREVEVVKHDKTCPDSLSPIPKDSRRFLGDLSGMAEYVNGAVIFCRHSLCWKLDIYKNKWTKVGGFQTVRDRAASVAVGDKMLVLGGRDPDGLELIGFEVYNEETDEWDLKPEWEMAQGRYSFCAAPVNSSAIVIIGGYSKGEGALASVEILDIESGRWETMSDLPKARFGHACLYMELAGAEGILVSGGALTGDRVDFLDLKTKKWKSLPDLMYRMDGHKMVMVEGIPTVFSWEHVEQFDGKEWINSDLRLTKSRSAFAVTNVPGHLIKDC